MIQPLFKKPRRMAKRAQAEGGQLPPNAAEWPVRIRDEFARTAPYAWDYPTEVVISEKDDQKGYAFGHIIVSSRTALSPRQAAGQVGIRFGVRTVKVPIIVEDFKLYPLDQIVTEEGAVLPLNENRLRESLFRPSAFDIPGKIDSTGLFGAVLYPPQREYGANAVSKVGSFPILEGISEGLYQDQIDKVARLIQEENLSEDILANPVVSSYLRKLNSFTPHPTLSDERTKLAYLEELVPDVMLVLRENGPSYRVKTAMRRAYASMEKVYDRGKALQKLGADVVKEADLKGMVIIVRRKFGDPEPEVMDAEPGPLFGNWKASCPAYGLLSEGGPRLGHLFSFLRNLLSGELMPHSLWTDGDSFALQDDMAIRPSRERSPILKLLQELPHGTGIFSWVGEDGKLLSTEPVRILAASKVDGKSKYEGETTDGKRVRIIPSSTVKDVAPAGDGTVLIPASAKWTHVGEKTVKLATVEEARRREKAAMDLCEIRYSDGLFRFTGSPIEKVAGTKAVSPIDALFLCGLMGLSKESAEKALARAYRRGSVKVAGVRPVTPFEDLDRKIRVKVAALKKYPIPEVPLLLKEATSLGDPQAVDAVLSLGFLNLDNIAKAVTFIPHLEGAQRKLGILLLQSRLGLNELPQDHLSRAISALEHTIAGLRRVSLRLAPAGASA